MHCSDVRDWSKPPDFRDQLHWSPRSLMEKIEPFTLPNMDLDPARFLQCVKNYTRNKVPAVSQSLYRKTKARSEKIKIAYLSSDFRQHPVGILIGGLLSLHDRKRFDIIGVSTGEDDGSAIRARLVSSFDRFLDVRAQNDYEIAKMLSDLEVDIVVDLNGHTDGSRPGVLALRPAPVQASFLGFTGTMGADFIDYIVADRVVAPSEQQPFYTEKLVHLPDCYLPNDSSRLISPHTPARSEAGLPVEGFCVLRVQQQLQDRPRHIRAVDARSQSRRGKRFMAFGDE